MDKLSQALPAQLESLRTRFAEKIDETTLGERDKRFHVMLTGQEHVKNRVRLLMEHGDAIRNLRGHDSMTGFLTIAIVIMQRRSQCYASNS